VPGGRHNFAGYCREPSEETGLTNPLGPYDMLEPEPSPAPRSPAAGGSALRAPTGPPPSGADGGGEPGATMVLARGLTKRCPRCGERDLFAGWLKIRDRCPRCTLRLEREEGGFLGAMTINYTATTLAWVIFLAAWLLVDLPGVNVTALTVASMAFVAVFPLLFFPFAKTIWAAVDYLVVRSAPGYRPDGADHAPGGG